jgi:hypothetical protein
MLCTHGDTQRSLECYYSICVSFLVTLLVPDVATGLHEPTDCSDRDWQSAINCNLQVVLKSRDQMIYKCRSQPAQRVSPELLRPRLFTRIPVPAYLLSALNFMPLGANLVGQRDMTSCIA